MRSTGRRRIAGFLVLAGIAGGLACTALAAEIVQVSQRNRAFAPKQVEANRGDILRINNDDGELVHHAYVKSDTFNFDSGEQPPGSHLDVPLTTAGTFTVLCAIHPKMRLTLTVK